ncbi:MAG: NADH-quinone oxidoreductase subunit, partial [Kribbellaceae bacterium]|nr:NADH-quinone oxidoreductase subunit [Kribbellaceae bacterium]
MHPYVPILILGVLAAIFVAGTLVTSALVGPKRYNRAKLDSYECG